MIFLQLDLADFDSIKKFAEEIKKNYGNFHCLINNAGLAVTGNEKTKNGLELHFGTNHLGPFLLTNLLLDNIKKNNARVVVVSSRMHEKAKVDFENFGKFTEKPKGERTNHLYNNSKLLNFYFAKELYKRGVEGNI